MAFNLTVKYRLITLLIVLAAYCSCTKEEYVTIDSKPVVADLTQVPYPKLSDYNFFEGALKNLKPSFGVIPYKPVTELFSDYALKKRFVWMPNGNKATYVNDFPCLTYLWVLF